MCGGGGLTKPTTKHNDDGEQEKERKTDTERPTHTPAYRGSSIYAYLSHYEICKTPGDFSENQRILTNMCTKLKDLFASGSTHELNIDLLRVYTLGHKGTALEQFLVSGILDQASYHKKTETIGK